MKNIKKISTRSISIGSMLSAALLCGCQRAGMPQNVGLDTTPIPADEAMQQRNWEESHAVYARTGVNAHATLFTYDSRVLPYSRSYSTSLTEAPLFLWNVILIPYAVWETHNSPYWAWGPIEAHGDTVAPTFSAMPPLPPSNEVAPEPQVSPEAQPENAPAPATEPAGQ